MGGLLETVTKYTTPVFERSTEDGTTYRIYRLGSLELRSAQEHGGQEELGAVFSTRAPPMQAPSAEEQEKSSKEKERITKVTEYVENDSDKGAVTYRYYVVLET